MKKKTIALITAVFFIMSLSGCAGMRVSGDAEKDRHKSEKQLKHEKEEEARAWLIEGIGAFAGLAVGGIVGAFVADKGKELGGIAGGAIGGGILGFFTGMMIFNNTKPGDAKPDDKKVQEYFDDYRNMQLKEGK